MSGETKTTGAQAAKPAKRVRAAATPERTLPILLILIGAGVLCVAFVAAMHYFYRPVARSPVLAPEFKDVVNNIAIQAPRNWSIDDRAMDSAVVIQGPKEPKFRPLIILAFFPAPGQLREFVAEHKARTIKEEPSVKFTAEDTASIDGREAMVLEYECDYSSEPGATPFKLKTLQWIVRDPQYYYIYKITCSARADTFEDHRAEFEASAKTFRILPLPQAKPRFVNE